MFSNIASKIKQKVTNYINYIRWHAFYKFYTITGYDLGSCRLYLEVDNGDFENAHMLIAQGANVNVKYVDGSTPLIIATGVVDNQISWDKIVKALVDHGANVNAHNMYGHCALLTATEYKQLNIARYLLEHGANIHVNYNNMTPLSLAFRVEEGTPYNMELIELLINH